MAVTSPDKEFGKYWSQLTALQKQSLSNFVKSFLQKDDGISIKQYNLELQEAEAEYGAGDYMKQEEMLKQLKEWEKKSVLLLIKAFLQGRKQKSELTSIEQYNKEIDEAMQRIDAGEFISHEDLEKESEQW